MGLALFLDLVEVGSEGWGDGGRPEGGEGWF